MESSFAKSWRCCQSGTGIFCTRGSLKSARMRMYACSLGLSAIICASCCTVPFINLANFIERKITTSRTEQKTRKRNRGKTMDAVIIDHQQAVNQMMTERYLLGELNPQERDAFEQHLFDCSECFEQVKAGTEFVHYLKGIGAEETAAVPSTPAWRRLLGQAFRPAPAFAFAACMLAAVSVYQNMVTIPMLKAPQPESRYTLEEDSRGPKEIGVSPNSRFRLALDFQPQQQFVSYE